MPRPQTQSLLHSLLYGGASALLLLDVFFLVKALLQSNFVPVLPVVAGILLAGGLLLVLYSESHSRELDKQEHRRLSRVANQLEAPLKSLQDDLQYLSKQGDKLPSAERLKLKRMETKANVLLENVRDVFLMMRAQQAPLAQDVRTYDMCKLVKEAVERVKPLASARNVEITQKALCADAPVKIDKSLVLIALVHILENGILYTMTPGLMNIAIIRGKSNVRVVVQDRGVGVKGEDKEAIFLPFARGRKAEQFDADGIGTGLTLSRLIVREFGGDLLWRPRPKAAGTEFEIKLPLAKV